MSDYLEQIEAVVQFLNGVFFSNTTVYILLATGLVFTFMTGFGQYRALRHGSAVIRGKYDDKDDPGAINHFQALSAALSATVGLGNIGGVAAAVALGGPGAVFWMWIIGVLGMSLKMTEVTQSMLYRNTDDPDNPHGGPMFVVSKGFKRIGLPKLGAAVGAIFCVTLILSAITGGNMFQAWNVAEVTTQYSDLPREGIGVVLAIIVGLVIIGGIKRIGAVAGRIVPLMCGIYVVAALAVLAVNIGEIPAMLWMIVEHGLGLQSEALPTGAFLGGTFGMAFLFGVKRALFSSEAGQGSSPIAHSAVKTDEPVREGIVAGLEPFIDTIVVCTMTALVLLSTGAWNRGPEGTMPEDPGFQTVVTTSVTYGGKAVELTGVVLERDGEELTMLLSSSSINRLGDALDEAFDGLATQTVNLADADPDGLLELVEDRNKRPDDKTKAEHAEDLIAIRDGLMAGARLIEEPGKWMPTNAAVITQSEDSKDISGEWLNKHDLFALVTDGPAPDEGATPSQLLGVVRIVGDGDNETGYVSWDPVESENAPELYASESQPGGAYGFYVGAGLTAHAFDRAFPGINLGMYLIIAASWLFAVSTMISWSYYGEQGIVFLFGESKKASLIYKLMYCVLVFVSTLDFIKTERELDMWTTLGLGAMLVANIPIMLLFATQSTAAYNDYSRRLKSGELEAGAHKPASFHDVVTGQDVKKGSE